MDTQDKSLPIIPKPILRFISRHHVLTLSTSVEDEVWCFNAFYALYLESAALVFTSTIGTYHSQQLVKNCYVGGSIVLESRIIGKLQGLQFQGVALKVKDSAPSTLVYKKRFPFVNLTKNLEIWQINLTRLKFTDNKFSFGQKLEWYRDLAYSSFMSDIQEMQGTMLRVDE